MQIIEGVYLPEGLQAGNAYIMVSEEVVVLIDAGTAGDVGRIEAELERCGRRVSELQWIILTHAHGDHAGGAAELVRRSGAQVLAHRDEVPYLQKSKPLPSGSVFGKFMRRIGDGITGGSDPIDVRTLLDDGMVLDVLGGLRVIHTPGHTPGSICLYQEQDHILFCGDLLLNGNPFTHRGGLRYAPGFFSGDASQAERSAQKLSSLSVRVLCVGHGEPIVRDAVLPMSEWLADVPA